MVHKGGARLRRTLRTLGAALVLGLLAPLAVVAAVSPATAAVYDASSVSLKFKQANRVAITGTTGTSVGDVMKYTSVTTINGIVVDGVVRTVATTGATIGKFDEGSAVGTAPVGSTQTVDDLFQTDLTGTSSTESSVTFEFSFYEGGTYTGANTGVPVTLGNVSINSYDIDGNGKKQFTDFRGFQSYKTYSESSTKGLDASDIGNGFVRFLARDANTNYTATSGSYSFTRVQVNYDQISVLTARIGVQGTGLAYYALDFSAGGMWTTNGSTEVIPTQYANTFNAPPTTADITTFFAAQGTGYVFRASDFPYADLENNAFALLKIATLPAAGEGVLEFNTGTAWVPVTAGDVITTSDLDLGKLRLIPTATGGSFGFQVNDGLAFSTSSTLTFTAPAGSQTIDFPNPGGQSGSTSQTFASGVTTSSGLTPTLTSLSTGVCTVSGLTITTLALPTGVNSATCVIIATQDGDADFGRAEAVTQQFSVSTLQPQEITFTNPGDREFSSASIVTDAVTSAPARTVTLTSLTLGVCTVSGTTIIAVSRGLCSVRATQPGDSTYSAASPVTRSFTLTKTSQVITFAQPATHALSTTPVTLTATTSASGLTPTLVSGTTAVCTVSGTTVTLVGTGTCTITASQPGDANYLAAADVVRSFDVFGITTVSLPDGQVGVAYSAPQTLDGGRGDGTWSSDPLPAGLSMDPDTGEITGTPTTATTWSGSVTYTEDGASHSVPFSFEVVPAAALPPQTITFAQPPTKAISTTSFTVSPTTDATGLTPGLASSTTAVCTVSGFTVSILTTGVCTLTASQAGDASYAPATDVTRTFRVIGITTTSLPGGQVASAYSTTLAATGGVGGGTWSTSGSLPAGITIDPTSGALAGTPTATFSAPVTVTYTEGGATHSVSLQLDVVAAPLLPQAITFARPGTKAVSATSFTVSPTTDASGLSPALAASTPAVCSVSGFTVTLLGTGTCTLTASQAGNSTYSAATDVTRSFQVLGITTTSLPAGRVGAAYSAPLAVAGAAGGGTWAVSGALPAGVTIDAASGVLSGIPTGSFDQSISVLYSEDGAIHVRVLRLEISAVAAPPVRQASRPAAKPVPAPEATPAPRAPVLAAAPAPSTVQAAAPTDEKNQATRSVAELQQESIAGFAPGSGVRVDVIGAKTLATFAVAPTGALDASAAAKAIRDATGETDDDFARLTDASAVSASEAGMPAVLSIPKADQEYFTMSGLPAPVSLASQLTSSGGGWVHFAVTVEGYKPGSTVYLAMTSTPVVFASSIVARDGSASVAGDMALDVLPTGVHHLRVIGDRQIGSVTVDSAGEIALTDAQLAEIQKFDQGTNATVRVSGDTVAGGSQLAVRIIPLDKNVPWWLLWALVALAGLLVVTRLARLGESTAMAWVKRVLLVLAAAVPIAVGLVIDVLPLTLAAGGVLVLGIVLATTLPKLGHDDDDDWDRALARESLRQSWSMDASSSAV